MRYLHVGGVIALGFDATDRYLLVVSHSGRGVFCTRTWAKLARDESRIYPEGGVVPGIGPLEGQLVAVEEMDYDKETVELSSELLGLELKYEEGTITVSET